MITVLPISALKYHAAVFESEHLDMVIESIMVGNTAGQCWHIIETDEQILVLWDKGNNVLYLSAVPRSATAYESLRQLLNETVRSEALAEGLSRFKVYVLQAAPDGALHGLFPFTSLQQYDTLFYRFDSPEPPTVAMPSIDGIYYVVIDQQLLSHAELGNKQEVLNEIRWMWPSEERFYAQGFGSAALVGNEIICWCTAEYVSSTCCGIGITTLPHYEQRGVATATAARFVHTALERGLVPYWECGINNIGSRRVAEKVGFTLVSEECMWVGSFTS